MKTTTKQYVYRVEYGWIGEPHRNRVRDFKARREAEAFQAKWKSGGKHRSAKMGLIRTSYPQFT